MIIADNADHDMETASMTQPLTAILIGAGQRGYEAYGCLRASTPRGDPFLWRWLNPTMYAVRALPKLMTFLQGVIRTWEDLFALGKIGRLQQ